jgi:hypothetical protein
MDSQEGNDTSFLMIFLQIVSRHIPGSARLVGHEPPLAITVEIPVLNERHRLSELQRQLIGIVSSEWIGGEV